MSHEDHKNFSEYGFSVTIDVVRKSGYSSEKFAHVVLEETRFIDTDQAVLIVMEEISRAATLKAVESADVRQTFEANMRALEAGPEYVDEGEGY